MVRGTGAASYTYLATVYTTLGIRAHPTRPEGAPGLVPSPVEPQDHFSTSADYADAASEDMFARFQETLERKQKIEVSEHF